MASQRRCGGVSVSASTMHDALTDASPDGTPTRPGGSASPARNRQPSAQRTEFDVRPVLFHSHKTAGFACRTQGASNS